MVSGFVTSPLDHERICFEDARPISMASKLLMSIKVGSSLLVAVGHDVDGGVDVVSVGGRGVVGHAGVALLDLLLLGLVGRFVRRGPVAGAHAGQVDAELLCRAQ